MAATKPKRIEDFRKKDDLIVVTGAGGFIAGSLVRSFPRQGLHPHPGRRQEAPRRMVPADAGRREPRASTSATADNCVQACEGAVEVYNLAADMGGMGFIERYRVECLRSVLINTHMIEAAQRAGADRYFFSSSACAYNIDLQKDAAVPGPQGIRRLPGQGRARLRLGEALLRDRLPGVLGRARPQDRASPASTTSTARTAPGTAAARRRRPPSRARSSRPGTTAAAPSRSGATARGRGASCRSTTASTAST